MDTKSKDRTQAQRQRRKDKRSWKLMTHNYLAWMDAHPEEQYGVDSLRQFMGEFLEQERQASSSLPMESI